MLKNVLIIILFSITLLGCENTNLNSTEETVIEENSQINEISGIITAKYVENNSNFLEIESNQNNITLNADNYDGFIDIIEGQNIDVLYNNENVITEVLSVNEPTQVEETNEEVVDNSQVEYSIIELEDSINTSEMNVFYELNTSDFSQDINSVEIYTNAEVDENGEFLWDDGHEFLVVARSDNGDYKLFEERIQHGSIKVNVFLEDDIFKLSLFDYGTAHIRFIIFEFNDDHFIKNSLYEGTGNINMIGNN